VVKKPFKVKVKVRRWGSIEGGQWMSMGE